MHTATSSLDYSTNDTQLNYRQDTLTNIVYDCKITQFSQGVLIKLLGLATHNSFICEV